MSVVTISKYQTLNLTVKSTSLYANPHDFLTHACPAHSVYDSVLGKQLALLCLVSQVYTRHHPRVAPDGGRFCLH